MPDNLNPNDERLIDKVLKDKTKNLKGPKQDESYINKKISLTQKEQDDFSKLKRNHRNSPSAIDFFDEKNDYIDDMVENFGIPKSVGDFAKSHKPTTYMGERAAYAASGLTLNPSAAIYNKALDVYAKHRSKRGVDFGGDLKNPIDRYVQASMGYKVPELHQKYNDLLNYEESVIKGHNHNLEQSVRKHLSEPDKYPDKFTHYDDPVTQSSLPDLNNLGGNIPKLREQTLAKLMVEDSKNVGVSLVNHLGSTLLGDKVINYAIDKANEKVVGTTRDHLINKMGEDNNYVKALDLYGSRIAGINAEKIGLRDITKLFNPTNMTIGAAGLAGANKLIKKGLGNILGVQDFYHATTPGTAMKITESGLDPMYGGIEGGATRNLIRESLFGKDFQKDPVKHIADSKRRFATNEFPTIDNLKLHSEIARDSIDVPTYRFLENATGRSFAGKGLLGSAGVSLYAQKTNPELFKNLTENVKGSIDAVNKLHPAYTMAQATFGGDVMKTFKDIPGNIKKALSLPKNIFNIHNALYSSKPGSSIVAGAMPYNEFHDKFEFDPDGVSYLKSDYRTKRPDFDSPVDLKTYYNTPEEIDAKVANNLSKVEGDISKINPEHFRLGDVSYKQIFNNRSRGEKWLEYAGSSTGRKEIAKGIGYLAGGIGLGAGSGTLIASPYVSLGKKGIAEYNNYKKKSILNNIVESGEKVAEVFTEKAKPNMIERVLAKKVPILAGAGALAGGAGLYNYINGSK